MTGRTSARGATLIEAMIALAILMIGASGLVGMQRQSAFFLGDSLRLDRATAIAQDLASQIDTWDFDDPRLANTTALNDADVGDSEGKFLVEDAPVADHAEDDLSAGGLVWNGLAREVVENAGMERYLNVAHLDDIDGNGIPDAARIAIVVRWRDRGAWRRIVFMTAKANMGDFR